MQMGTCKPVVNLSIQCVVSTEHGPQILAFWHDLNLVTPNLNVQFSCLTFSIPAYYQNLGFACAHSQAHSENNVSNRASDPVNSSTLSVIRAMLSAYIKIHKSSLSVGCRTCFKSQLIEMATPGISQKRLQLANHSVQIGIERRKSKDIALLETPIYRYVPRVNLSTHDSAVIGVQVLQECHNLGRCTTAESKALSRSSIQMYSVLALFHARLLACLKLYRASLWTVRDGWQGQGHQHLCKLCSHGL